MTLTCGGNIHRARGKDGREWTPARVNCRFLGDEVLSPPGHPADNPARPAREAAPRTNDARPPPRASSGHSAGSRPAHRSCGLGPSRDPGPASGSAERPTPFSERSSFSAHHPRRATIRHGDLSRNPAGPGGHRGACLRWRSATGEPTKVARRRTTSASRGPYWGQPLTPIAPD